MPISCGASRPGFLLCLLATTISFVTGCGGSKKPPVYTVKGVVNYNGKPMVGGGSILFLPTKGGAGKEASGIINSKGEFELSTYSEQDGAPVGEFKIVINQTTTEEPEGGSDGGGSPEEGKEIPKADQIPLIYADPSQTPLKETIPEGGRFLRLELEPKAGNKQKGA